MSNKVESLRVFKLDAEGELKKFKKVKDNYAETIIPYIPSANKVVVRVTVESTIMGFSGVNRTKLSNGSIGNIVLVAKGNNVIDFNIGDVVNINMKNQGVVLDLKTNRRTVPKVNDYVNSLKGTDRSSMAKIKAVEYILLDYFDLHGTFIDGEVEDE